MHRIGKTSLNGNPWRLSNNMGIEQNVASWEQLNWTQVDDDEKAWQNEVLHEKIFTEMIIGHEAGRGSFGVAYQCKFPSLSPLLITIKLPLLLLEAPAELSIVQGRLTVKPHSRARFNAAVTNFTEEIRNYEKIYDPPSLSVGSQSGENHSVGKLVHHLDQNHYKRMQTEIKAMRAHPGHAHIHVILHYDANIPAIFSSACDGTLKSLRKQNPHALFDAISHVDETWQMSTEWLRVARHVGLAISYIHHMQMVHLDIKDSNVLFRRCSHGGNHYLLSDFGFCAGLENTHSYNHCHTTEYVEPTMWRHKNEIAYNPMRLCVYTFAILMVSCLKIPGITFPFSIEFDHFKTFRNFDSEIAYFAQRNQTIATLFPAFFLPLSNAFKFCYPEWSCILDILRLDYTKARDQDAYVYLTNLLQIIQPAAFSSEDVDMCTTLSSSSSSK